MIKLIISDFDGTIAQLHGQYQSSWDSVGNLLKKQKREEWFAVRDFYLGKIHKAGSITDKLRLEAQWFAQDLYLMKGENVENLLQRIEMNYTKGAREFFKEMKKQGKIIGILSAGVDFIIEKAAKELEMDFSICTKIYHKNGILTGEGEDVVDLQNKLDWFKKLRKKYHIRPKEVVYLGDHFNCIPCLKEAGLGIAINAKTEEVKKAAKYALKDFRGAAKLIGDYERGN